MFPNIVPWRTSEQFLKVYEYVYSEDIAKKRWAVDQIDVWETRCWPALPFAIEATLFMVRANIQDLLFVADKSLCHAREVEMMYATAIIRFINLILEKDKLETASLTEAAEKKNIPAWIVEVRHGATHGFCPSLPVLRMAYKIIMQSLQTLFWAPESTRISLFKRPSHSKQHMFVLLQEYRTIQHQNIKSPVVDKLVKKALTVVCDKIGLFLYKEESRYEFLQTLVHPDNFITEEDFNCLKGYEKKALKEDNSGSLPKTIKKIWTPLLRTIQKYDSIPMFVELLLLSQENRTIKLFQKIADALVLYILSVNCLDPSPPETEAYLKKKPLFNYFRLLYSCMKGSSDSSKPVFDKLSASLPLGNWREELFSMLSIRQGLTVIKENNKGEMVNKGQKRKFDITFTVGDLEEDIYAEMTNRNPKIKKNHWSLAPISMDFANIPLGYVFNPVEKEKKEEKKPEVINKKSVDNLQMFPPITEDSMPIEQPKLANFIFQRLPAQSYMLYTRRNKK